MGGDARRDHLSLRFRSDPRLLCVVRSTVRRFAELAGFGERPAEDIVLAVDESLTNVIRHCYAGRTTEPLELDVWLEDAPRTTLAVRIRDFGPPIDPKALRPPADKDLAQPGGLGLALIHRVMESVTLGAGREEDGGGNVLVLRTTCPEPGRSEP